MLKVNYSFVFNIGAIIKVPLKIIFFVEIHELHVFIFVNSCKIGKVELFKYLLKKIKCNVI